MPLLIKDIAKRYGNNWALRDVTFDVADGEIFGIFGGTAAGKTTLLRCFAGTESINGGSVDTGGKDFYLGPEPKTGGLTAIFGRKNGELSAGEARVAEIERTLENGAGILLLDDPFAGVDAAHFERLADKIRSIAAGGRIVIFASTEFREIAALCERVAVISAGYVRQIGFTQEVYDNPESSSVAAIVGQNNLFEARRLTSTNADMPEFFTIEGGHRLFAHPTEKAKLGAINQNVTLSIRPEHVSITFGASFPEDNVLKAVVTRIRFLGETTLVELDADGLKLSARVFRIVGLNIGEECMIGMPPHRILVLKD